VATKTVAKALNLDKSTGTLYLRYEINLEAKNVDAELQEFGQDE
jgi:hypothetical protein